MKKSLQKNPRLIQIDKAAIWEMATRMCAALHDVMSSSSRDKNKPIGEDPPPNGLLSRVFEYKLPRTREMVEFRIFWQVQDISFAQYKKLLSGDLMCPNALMGGALELEAGSQQHNMLRSHIHLFLCPVETRESLAKDSKKKHFIDQVYETLIHEITHASEYGRPGDDYSDQDPKNYYNQPWELRAHVRQIAEEVVKRFREVEPYSTRTRTDLLDSILNANKRFQRVYPNLTAANKKKLLQLVARELEEYRDLNDLLLEERDEN